MGMDVNPSMLGGMLLGAALGMRGKSGAPAQQAPAPAPQPQRRPDPVAVLQDTAAQAAAVPGTYLTGPQGVDPKTVKTTKQSLYGN